MRFPAPPVNRLGDEPRIESLADVDAALAELSWLKSSETAVNEECESACRKLREKAQEQLQTIGHADRCNALAAEIHRYCEDEKKSILADGGKKSRELTHGTIGWRQTQVKIEPIENPKAVLAIVEKAVDLTTKLVGLFGRLKVCGVKLGLFLECKPALSLTRAKAAVKDKQITPANLKKLGLKIVEPVDEFYCDIAAWPVGVEREAAA